MTEQEYMKYTNDLRKEELNPVPSAIEHGITGMAGEMGEIVDIKKRLQVYGKPIDRAHMLEELGDMFHYMTYIMHYYNWTIKDVMEYNKLKLDVRYPEGYSDKAALARKDKVLCEHITTS